MRPAPYLCALAAVALTACTTTRADGSPQIQTSSDATTESLQGALSAPLRDINILRTKVPEVLLESLADPYQRPVPMTCETLIAEIRPLDGALGADLDEPSTDEDDLLDKGGDTLLGAVAGAAQDVIPFRGWVRKLTGADRHDRMVRAAIQAGAVRRAYLKGIGEAQDCPAPARPARTLQPQPVISQDIRPRYPTR